MTHALLYCAWLCVTMTCVASSTASNTTLMALANLASQKPVVVSSKGTTADIHVSLHILKTMPLSQLAKPAPLNQKARPALQRPRPSRCLSRARLRERAAAGGARGLRLGAVDVREHAAPAEGGQVRVVRRRAHAHGARAAAEEVAQVVPAHAHARAPGLSRAPAAAAWSSGLDLCALACTAWQSM